MSSGAHTCTWACWTHAHVHIYRHTGHEGARQSWGDTCPGVWIKDPWRQTHMQTHTQNSLICQADIPSWRSSSPVEETRAGGEGLVFVVNGSLSAGGPLPAPYMYTCDISHQHLLSPLQALQACDGASHCIAECGSTGTAKRSLRPPRPLRHKGFGHVGRMGWWGYGW